MGTGDGVARGLGPDRARGSRGRSEARDARGGRGVVAHPLRCALVRQPRRGRLVAGVRAGRGAPRVAERWRAAARRARPGGAASACSGWCGCFAPWLPAASWPGASGRGADESGADPAPEPVLRRGAEPPRHPGSPRPRPPWSAGPRLALELRERLAGELRPDGTVRGASLPTMWRVHELLDLGSRATAARSVPPHRPGLGALQGRRGAFRRGMRQGTASRRVCEHFLVGFFSPAPPEQRLTPVTLPNGKVFRAEPAARFALSVLALRAHARGPGTGRPPVRRHLRSLARFAEQWTGWASAARARCDRRAACMRWRRPGLPGATRATGWCPIVAERQGEEGRWIDADLFPMLVMLLALGSADARQLVCRPCGPRGSATLRRELRRYCPTGAGADGLRAALRVGRRM